MKPKVDDNLHQIFKQGEIMNEFAKALADVPQWMLDCPVSADWFEYKGETYFAFLNYERSIKSGRPMIDLSYCATKAMNGIVLKTVQYSDKYFKRVK